MSGPADELHYAEKNELNSSLAVLAKPPLDSRFNRCSRFGWWSSWAIRLWLNVLLFLNLLGLASAVIAEESDGTYGEEARNGSSQFILARIWSSARLKNPKVC